MKAEVDKLHVNKLVHVLVKCWNNLKTKVDDLDVDKLKKCACKHEKINRCSE